MSTGDTLGHGGYHLHTKHSFERLYGSRELVIMVHGLRNNRAGAAQKFAIIRRRLRALGYVHPVVGYSYDSDVRGAHLKRCEGAALRAGRRIAQKNGHSLARFVADFKQTSPGTRVRLVGHSLGAQVILSAVGHLARSAQNRHSIESIHLFGASISSCVPSSPVHRARLRMVVRRTITNHYAPTDEVLLASGGSPLGLKGASGRTSRQYRQRCVRPKNHRFRSYAAVLGSFP